MQVTADSLVRGDASLGASQTRYASGAERCLELEAGDGADRVSLSGNSHRLELELTPQPAADELRVMVKALDMMPSERIRAIPGLVGFWDFSEPAGSERMSKWTPQDHALAEVGGPIARTAHGPVSGYSAYLDGRRHFVIPHDRTGDLNIHGTNAQVSMVAFIKIERMDSFIAGMWNSGSREKGDDSGVRQYALLLNVPEYGGRDRVCPHVSATGGFSRDTAPDGTEYTLPWCGDHAVSASKVALNRWVSVGFTYDGTWIKAYYNGVFEPQPGHPERPALDLRDHDYYTKTCPGGGYRGMNPYYQPHGIYTFNPGDPGKLDTGSPFSVGAEIVGKDAHPRFKGWIGGLAVFDRALSEAEMRAIHNAALER